MVLSYGINLPFRRVILALGWKRDWREAEVTAYQRLLYRLGAGEELALVMLKVIVKMNLGLESVGVSRIYMKKWHEGLYWGQPWRIPLFLTKIIKFP